MGHTIWNDQLLHLMVVITNTIRFAISFAVVGHNSDLYDYFENNTNHVRPKHLVAQLLDLNHGVLTALSRALFIDFFFCIR